MIDLIKRLLTGKKKYPNFSNSQVKHAVSSLIQDYIKYPDSIYRIHAATGIVEAIGPSYKKHRRNHILASFNDKLEKTMELTAPSGSLYTGYKNLTVVDKEVNEGLLPYCAYAVMNYPKSTDAYENFGELVERLRTFGLNKNPLSKEEFKISTLPLNEEYIHLNSFATVATSLGFKDYRVNEVDQSKKDVVKYGNNVKLPSVFNKDILLSLYNKAKVTKNKQDIKNFTAMFNLDTDNNLFPAVLAFDLNVITKQELKQFLTLHKMKSNTMDKFNLLAPIYILLKKINLENI